MHAIEKAILTSDIGINPTNDGRVMRLVFPAPTEMCIRDRIYCIRADVSLSKKATYRWSFSRIRKGNAV